MEVERNQHTSHSSLPSEKEKPVITFQATAMDVPIISLSNPRASGSFINQEASPKREFYRIPWLNWQTEKEVIAKPEDSMDVEGYRTKFKKDLDAWVDHLFHRIWPPSRVSYRIWPKNLTYRSISMEFSN
ncbi:hypothetical protein F2Q68_00018998 [Brassica cretica]|uniref:Uncharacterized protein n=1 Tax=Brassica cretica TaxID=69181 RepID=A0A8S9FVM6_BRACR|nr:hypothetical protein F2Q68_00018998 [Brassica cretica]